MLPHLLPVFTISQILSPLLPVALIAGQVLATVRLSENGIFCVNPSRIAIAGKARVFCFDKTGTLTTDMLDFLGARPVIRKGGDDDPLALGDLWHPHESQRSFDPNFVHALASCHAVAKFGENLVGNQVEVKMFQATDWDLAPQPDNTTLLTSPNGKDTLNIVRRFEFDHERQAMSVVVRDKAGAAFIFVKGSFEKISDITRATSVPEDYKRVAKGMALDGCYVLAVAMKPLGDASPEEISELDREAVETDLELLGLIAFRNELKVRHPAAGFLLSASAVATPMTLIFCTPPGSRSAGGHSRCNLRPQGWRCEAGNDHW